MTDWLTVAGERMPELETLLAERVADHHRRGDFTIFNERYIKEVDLSVTRDEFSTSKRKQELLRRLCQIYHVELTDGPISSHRAVIGPVIVFCKKLAFRILRPFLSRSLRQQRDFNAGVVALLAELANERNNQRT